MNIIRSGIPSDIEKHPVVVGIVAIRELVVPAVQQSSVKFDENHPDKFIKQTIANNCSSLSNKLRKIIQTGDCGLYVLLRNQLKNFMTICQKFIIPANDIRPLMQLQEEIEKCDKNALIQAGMVNMKHLISRTNYFPQDQLRDNKWKILEDTLLEVTVLAKEFGLSLDEIQKLMDEYYIKHVEGVLWEIEQCEQWRSQFVPSKVYGGGQGSFAKKDPKEISKRLVAQISGKVSEPTFVILLAKIEKHGKDAPIRKWKLAFNQLFHWDIAYYYRSLQNLKDAQGKLSAGYGNGFLMDDYRSSIVCNGANCISPLRGIVKELLMSGGIYEWLDAQFVWEMQELLIWLHFQVIESALTIEQKEFYERERSISDRLGRMKADIDMCSTNKVRFPVWSRWHANLSARTSSPRSVFPTKRPIPGGASWKRKS